MTQLAWLTDIHLNFVDPEEFSALGERVQQCGADAMLIGGDIAEADSFSEAIRQLAAATQLPIFFVLGNHDFYRGSITTVREEAELLSYESPLVAWLPAAGVVQLSESATLVGHGGWGDGRIGDFLQSDVVLNDYLLIEELAELSLVDGPMPELTPDLLARLNALGDEAAEHFRQILPTALETSNRVLVLTHVPPFREACWHEGQLSDDNWAPHFTCQAVGAALMEIMSAHPDRKMTVLCGHTHSSGHARILDNLEVFTGQAVYGQPTIQRVLDID